MLIWDSGNSNQPGLAGFDARARHLLPDDFFWDSDDEYGPVGDDDGADVLNAYRKWRLTHSAAERQGFLNELFHDWGLPDNWVEDFPETAPPDVDEHRYYSGNKVIIAFAFSQIMVDGTLDRHAQIAALRAIARHKMWVERYPNTRVTLEILQKLERMADAIRNL